MSNHTQLLIRPIKDGCKFNCLNPLVYLLQRQDLTYSLINNSGGFIQIKIPGVDESNYFDIGDQVYIQHYGAGSVTSSGFGGGDTQVTTDIPFVATNTGYVNNLSKRTDYKVELEVFDFATDESLGPRIVSDFDEVGNSLIDISGIVKSYLYAFWEPVTVAATDGTTAKKVYIKYQEFYDATYFELRTDAVPIVAVFGFIPLVLNPPPNFIRYLYGGNLRGFLPISVLPGKWLTRFEELSMWRGFPFTVSVLWENSSMNFRILQYDSENNILADASTTIVLLPDTMARLGISGLAAATTRLRLVLEDTSTNVDLLQQINVRVADPCENPVMLFWKNSLGGDAFWLFDESQDFQQTLPNGRRVHRMTLYADNLSFADWIALNELNSPTDVYAQNIIDYGMDNSIDKTHFRSDNQVYIISATGEKLGVIVINTDQKFKTFYKKTAIELTIELPEIFVV